MLHQGRPTFDQGRECHRGRVTYDQALSYDHALIEGSANFRGANMAFDKASTLQNILFYAHLLCLIDQIQTFSLAHCPIYEVLFLFCARLKKDRTMDFITIPLRLLTKRGCSTILRMYSHD